MITSLGASASKNDFICFATDGISHLRPSFLNGCMGFKAVNVRARGIAEILFEMLTNHFINRRVDRRSSVVIEIDGIFGRWHFSLPPRRYGRPKRNRRG